MKPSFPRNVTSSLRGCCKLSLGHLRSLLHELDVDDVLTMICCQSGLS